MLRQKVYYYNYLQYLHINKIIKDRLSSATARTTTSLDNSRKKKKVLEPCTITRKCVFFGGYSGIIDFIQVHTYSQIECHQDVSVVV